MIDNGEPMILEVNTVPGFTDQGNLCTILRASGLWFPGFLLAELQVALSRGFWR